MHRSIALVQLAAVSFALGHGQASAGSISIDPSAVQWSHLLLPELNDQNPFISALPTSGTVLYDNITPWRRGLEPGYPETMFYQAPGNDQEIWTSDDLHLTSPATGFNEVHFVIRTFQPDRPISLALWASDAGLGWPDPATPAPFEFSISLPEAIPSEDFATLVTVTLPFTIDLGEHMWMGLQSLVEDAQHEQIAFSSAAPGVGWSDEWWSQVPGTQMQNAFFNIPNNFAYGLSYAVPAPSLGLPLGVAALAMRRRRRGA